MQLIALTVNALLGLTELISAAYSSMVFVCILWTIGEKTRLHLLASTQ